MAKKKIDSRLMKFLQWTVIGTSIIFIAAQVINNSATEPPPDLLRSKTLDSQEDLSERCMVMMEEIQLLLVEGDIDAIQYYRCPLHDQPYVITYDGDTIVVSDPDPALHGFRTVSVSNKNPDIILID